MSEKLIQLSKDSVIPVSLGLLAALMAGVWSLAFRVKEWENRLEGLESSVRYSWTYHMEREVWSQFSLNNPELTTPDIEAIRIIYSYNK